MVREGRKARAAKTEQSRTKLWAGVAALSLLVVVVGILVLSRPESAPPLAVEEDPVLGEASAPVTVFYFADFQCPYCARFETGGNMDRLKADYIDTGKAKLVFKDFVIIGEDSLTAHQASQFVWQNAPSVYWAWHRGLYEIQGAERSGWASQPKVVQYSSKYPGIDAAELDKALTAQTHRTEVVDDKREGESHGVNSTPTVVVNGKRANPLNYDEMKGLIEGALGAAGAGSSG